MKARNKLKTLNLKESQSCSSFLPLCFSFFDSLNILRETELVLMKKEEMTVLKEDRIQRQPNPAVRQKRV